MSDLEIYQIIYLLIWVLCGNAGGKRMIMAPMRF